MPASFDEVYNGYWVATRDARPRNFVWRNTMIADSNAAVFVAQTFGVGRGTVKVKLTFEGLVENADGEGVWIYNRDKWFWRMTFKDAAGKAYVFVTFKQPRGPVVYDSFRTSVFGCLYDDTGIVGNVRWRITFKEVSRLYKTINPWPGTLANRLWRLFVMYPVLLVAGTVYSSITAPIDRLKSILAFAFAFYAGELNSDLAASDYMMPFPFEEHLSDDAGIPS